MGLKELIFKWFSYIFIGFITLIIIISFGMPDFITSSANTRKIFAAKVGDEVITYRELEERKSTMQREMIERFGEKMAKNFESFTESQALQNTINDKIQYLIAKESGFEPKGLANTKILAKYLKTLKDNGQFIDNQGEFDFDQFEKALNSQKSITNLSDLQNELSKNLMLRSFYFLTGEMKVFEDTSVYEALENSKISMKVLVLNEKTQNQIVSKRYNPTESEIQKTYQKKYSKKANKNGNMTNEERETIVELLRQDRKLNILENLISEINKNKLKLKLSVIQKKLGGSLVLFSNLLFTKTLNSSRPKLIKHDFLDLETSPKFFSALNNSHLKNILPVIKTSKNIYVIKLIKVNLAEPILNKQSSGTREYLRNGIDLFKKGILIEQTMSKPQLP